MAAVEVYISGAAKNRLARQRFGTLFIFAAAPANPRSAGSAPDGHPFMAAATAIRRKKDRLTWP